MFDPSRHRLPPTSFRVLDDALLDPRSYARVFERLRQRAAERPRMLGASKAPEAIPLAWLLANERRVTAGILEALVSPDFSLGLHRKVTIFAGKPRDIFVAEWPDRILLMTMGHLLAERLEQELTAHVHSFRRGRSHWNARSAFRAVVRGQPRGKAIHVLRRDVRKYGDSIDPRRAVEELRTRLDIAPESLFARVLCQALRADHCVDGQRRALEAGIPSGSPLTPPIENLYLDPLDRALGALPGAFYARYGDDFLFASGNPDQTAEAARTIDRVLLERGLETSADKACDATLAQAGQGVEWLGFRVARDGRLGSKRDRWRGTRRRLCGRIDRLVEVAYRSDLDERQRLHVLRTGLKAALAPTSDPALGSLFFEQDDPEALRALDRDLVQHLSTTLGRREGGKHRGWQLFRRLGYRSLAASRTEERWR